ncbi:MAG: S41 family peptidase [Puniceicoccales bacterium]|nr:S41 family peptidase [Puniceicoccales bacterium]
MPRLPEMPARLARRLPRLRHLPLYLLVFCIAAGATHAGATLWFRPEARLWLSPDFWREWLRVGEVMRRAAAHYYEPADAVPARLAQGALTGAAARLDKYSAYLPPERLEEMNDRSEQTYTGLGFGWETLDHAPVVVRVFKGGGAAEAGLRPGDALLSVDGVALDAFDREGIQRAMRGEAGTSALLRVRRDGEPAPLELRVKRRRVRTQTVTDARVLAGGTGYLRVTNFENHTAEEVGEALDAFAKEGAGAVVLDLRGNPGGVISTAVRVVGLFCPKGTVVTTSRGRHSENERRYATDGDPRAPELPLAVLVDGESASAAELVSGALQDLRRAVVVGERTYGKGVVQTIFPLSGKDALRLTTARYFLPGGRCVQGTGVTPDIAQPLDARSRGLLALARAWREAGRADAAFARCYGVAPPPDPQLAAALDVLALLRRNRRVAGTAIFDASRTTR